MISESFDAFVCDLDGVIYRGTAPVPGAAGAVNALRAAGKRFLFCTNNSTATIEQYVERLERFGIEAGPDAILTSATVTANVLSRRGTATAYLVGQDGIAEELERVGIREVADPEAETPDAVVVGADRTFTWEKLRVAADAVLAGAVLVATNPDPTFPDVEGLLPGAGALVAAIEVASGTQAEVMGKPAAPMMEEAARRLEGAERIAAIGDQPITDLAGAASMGWGTILVLSGATTSAEGLSPAPDHVLGSIAELVDPQR
jgi:4-nitrophenyl phosphatase